MHEFLKPILLRWLKVPAEPEAPAGSPGSVTVFRAAPNFYKLQLALWGLRQALGLIGIMAFLGFWNNTVGRRVPDHVNLLVMVSEWAGIALFLAQLPITYMMVRLDYEMRWYIVTDRSLRIRKGLFQVNEATLTFANIQQITVLQGPVQRLMGIYDLQVTTAGGGSSGGHSSQHGQGTSMHQGFFHGIANAPEVRTMMLERLRHLRDTGLGDPDEAHTQPLVPVHTPDHSPTHTPAPSHASPTLLQAATELLDEVRALRQCAGSSNPR